MNPDLPLVCMDRHQEHSSNVNTEAFLQRTFEQAEGIHAQQGVRELSAMTEAPAAMGNSCWFCKGKAGLSL